PPPPRARADRLATRARPLLRPPCRDLPLPPAPARDHRSVRRPAATRLGPHPEPGHDRPPARRRLVRRACAQRRADEVAPAPERADAVAGVDRLVLALDSLGE